MPIPWQWGRSRFVVAVLWVAFTIAGGARDIREQWRNHD